LAFLNPYFFRPFSLLLALFCIMVAKGPDTSSHVVTIVLQLSEFLPLA